MSTQLAQDKPPHVAFEYKAVEDRPQTVATGKYSTKDVAFARVTRPGSRDTLEVEAETWLQQLQHRAKQSLCPDSWAKGFREMFEAWKKGEEIPTSGTPIKGWQLMSPAAQNMIVQAGFRTVEELANASDSEAGAIGMGAVELRAKARLWLEQASGPGKVIERLNALEVQAKTLAETNAALDAENKRLRALYEADKK